MRKHFRVACFLFCFAIVPVQTFAGYKWQVNEFDEYECAKVDSKGKFLYWVEDYPCQTEVYYEWRFSFDSYRCAKVIPISRSLIVRWVKHENCHKGKIYYKWNEYLKGEERCSEVTPKGGFIQWVQNSFCSKTPRSLPFHREENEAQNLRDALHIVRTELELTRNKLEQAYESKDEISMELWKQSRTNRAELEATEEERDAVREELKMLRKTIQISVPKRVKAKRRASDSEISYPTK